MRCHGDSLGCIGGALSAPVWRTLCVSGIHLPLALIGLRALGDAPVRDIFSYRSPSFKALGLSADILDDSTLIRLMLSEPRLIRRPIIKTSERLIIGPNQATLTAAFL